MLEFPPEDNSKPQPLTSLDLWNAVVLMIVVFLSRWLTRAQLYYVDGPLLVKCIRDRTYVIQSPGYWLYAHLGGLFPDPAFGLQFWNVLCCSLGAGVFYLLCRSLQRDRVVSMLASIAYICIFYIWLASVVHSSYGTQILFAPLTVLLFLKYREKRTNLLLIACAFSFAIGAGLRPSDGGFMVPMFLYLTWTCVEGFSRKLQLLAVALVVCLGWYIPTQIASHATQVGSMGHQVGFAREVSPLLTGINLRSLANTLRVVLPLLTAFWMLIPAIFSDFSFRAYTLFLLWIIPGLCFMLLMFMADPVYLTYLSGAIILMAALAKRRIAIPSLAACALLNLVMFFGATPIRGDGHLAQALNFYLIKYSNYGVRHQWASTIGRGAEVPR